MGIVIDTSWLIAVERSLSRDSSIVLQLPNEPFVSGITIAELRVGVELADVAHRENREQFVDTILRSARILPFGTAEALQYGRLVAHLRRAGQNIGERDLLIAATAMANGHSILTHNRAEFERVPGLPLAPDPLAPNP
jgi:tRNA(fMet)-specific endonuclease VapC